MIISPCISICKTDPSTGYCYGCGRSNEEKRLWKLDETTDVGRHTTVGVKRAQLITQARSKKNPPLSRKDLAKLLNNRIILKTELFSNDGSKKFIAESSGDINEAKKIGYQAGEILLKKAGQDFIRQEN